MAKRKPQADNPWVSKRLFDALQNRCASAEQCLRDLIGLIDPDMLVACEYDWVRATHRILKGEDPA